MTNYFIRAGLVEKLSNKDSESRTVGFDMMRWLKKMLTRLNVSTYDKCCDTTTTTRPVRWNTEDSIFEYFDGTTWIDTGFVSG